MSQTPPVLGATVGLVAALSDGGYRRVLGIVVSLEGENVVLAVPLGSVGSEEVSRCGEADNPVEFHFISVLYSEVSTDVATWRKATQFEGVPSTRELSRAYCAAQDAQPAKVDTDTMVSANSGNEQQLQQLKRENAELKRRRADDHAVSTQSWNQLFAAYPQLGFSPGQAAASFGMQPSQTNISGQTGDSLGSDDDPARGVFGKFSKTMAPPAAAGLASTARRSWTVVPPEGNPSVAVKSSNIGAVNPSGIQPNVNPWGAMLGSNVTEQAK